MSRARARVAGELAAWQVAMVITRITGEQLDPAEINPYREWRPPPPKSEAQQKIENEIGWRMLFKGVLGYDPREKTTCP